MSDGCSEVVRADYIRHIRIVDRLLDFSLFPLLWDVPKSSSVINEMKR